MIRKSDGTPYTPLGSMAQFDPESNKHNLFQTWDSEVIRLFGSPIFLYEVYIQFQTMDELYLEDRGKLWSPIPIQLHAVYEPIPSQNALGTFGIDSPDEMAFELNHKAVIEVVGHLPKIGSRIFTPHKRENWVIIQRNAGEFAIWGQQRLQLICQRFQESVTTGEGKVSQSQPGFKID